MPANEDLYALLIMGNAINNDLGAAEELIEVMKANGLVPKQTAYSALLSGMFDDEHFCLVRFFLSIFRIAEKSLSLSLCPQVMLIRVILTR